MSYIGKEPQYTDFLSKFFSGDGTAMTVTLDASPPNEAALLVFIDGVRQDTSAYTVSGYSLTFTGAVPSGTNNVQVVHLGIAQDTQVPVDDSVSTAKIQDDAVTSAKLDTNIAIDGDLTVDTNTLHVDSTNNKVGIGTTSPAKELDVSGEIRASTGILFGTDTASDNTLDDYEEGTFTITLGGATTDPTTAINQTAKYTKIGRVVHVKHAFTNVNTTGASGDIQIRGFPFANLSGGQDRAVGTVWGNCMNDSGTDITTHMVLSLGNSSTVAGISKVYSLAGMDIKAQTSAYLYLNLTYFVA